MKKVDLIHLIITSVGIFLMYSAIYLLPNFITYLLFWLSDGFRGGNMLEGMLSVFLMLAIYLIAASLVLKNSKKLSTYIANKYDVHNPPIVNTSRHDLLYILFIGLGIYNLLQRLPTLLQALYQSFSHENKSGLLQGVSKSVDLAPQIISVLLSVFFIFYAKYLADQFSDKLPSEQDEDNSEQTYHL